MQPVLKSRDFDRRAAMDPMDIVGKSKEDASLPKGIPLALGLSAPVRF